jgi:hypothetical protein
MTFHFWKVVCKARIESYTMAGLNGEAEGMQRRKFLVLSGAAAMASAAAQASAKFLGGSAEPMPLGGLTLYVALNGKDENPGTANRPLATLQQAQQIIRRSTTHSSPVTVVVREGTYYLGTTLSFEPKDSGTKDAPIVYIAEDGHVVTLSGGVRLHCDWKPYRDGILMASVPRGVEFSQLFVNGKRQTRARYPNYDPSVPGTSGYLTAAGAIPPGTANPFKGTDDDVTYSAQAPRGVRFDPGTFTGKKWTDSKEMEIHIFQAFYWGNMQWKIDGVDRNTNSIWFGIGGDQMGAKYNSNPAAVDGKSRYFIDNVFEELDTPGEWFLDKQKSILYYYPPKEIDLKGALIEAPILEHVVEFKGTQQDPVHFISMRGFRFAHTASTYLKNYEVPSLSDWAIHRGGTVFAEGSRNCQVLDCWFDAVGGNAVFVNNYNRSFSVSNNKFTETGDSAICFVGDIEKTNGTELAFPYECQANNNLIHDCGVYGKQIAGVYISRAKRITANHNHIYNMPRAGICIGDGTWGGHVIEYNHIHNTILETSDHGPFNSWGRERGWSLAHSHGTLTDDHSIDTWAALVDAMEPVIVRNNYLDEPSGWGLDLDDGSSNYEIYNNISAGGISMKLREGDYRKVYNNIWYLTTSAPAFAMGSNFNHDQYFNNITVVGGVDIKWPAGSPWWPQMFYSIIAPPSKGPWLEKIDNNCFYAASGEFQVVVNQLRSEEGKRIPKRYDWNQWKALGFDRNSIFGDPLFIDPAKGDFRVMPQSPALKLGFKNFEMGKWGLTDEFSSRWREPIAKLRNRVLKN